VFGIKVGSVISSGNILEEVRAIMRGSPAEEVFHQDSIEGWGEFLSRMEGAQPDLVIIEFGEIERDFAESIKRIKSISSTPRVLILNTSKEPEVILGAIRAGADEYLYPPLEADLRRALERFTAERAAMRAGTRPRGKVLGFLSAKGGCGATTLACHIGLELQRQTNMEVLVADFDLENGLIGFLTKAHTRHSILDAADNIQRLDINFWKAIVSNGIPGVDVVGAPPAGSLRIYRNPDDYKNLVRFMRANYDWTVADLGRGLTYAALSVMDELDEIYLVSEQEVPTLHLTRQLVSHMRERGIPEHRIHVIMNRMPSRSEITLEEIDRMLGISVYVTLPSEYHELYDAMAEGGFVKPESTLGRHFERIAGRITGLEIRPKKKGFSFFS
jgi:pilus assembly protein CpaE